MDTQELGDLMGVSRSEVKQSIENILVQICTIKSILVAKGVCTTGEWERTEASMTAFCDQKIKQLNDDNTREFVKANPGMAAFFGIVAPPAP